MKKLYSILIVLCLIASCKSYKEVNTFSAKASENLLLFNNIHYNFNTNCNEKCYLRALEDQKFTIDKPKCDCEKELLADKNIARIINALDTYFKALQAISSDDISTAVSYDAVANPLIENEFLMQEDIQPYKSLSEIITSVILESYRSNQLTKAIERSHPDVDSLLRKLQEIINNNLIAMLKNRRGELQQIYIDVYSDKANTNYDRFYIKDKYFKELAKIDAKETELKAYSESLEKILMGHQTLYHERNYLDTETTKNSITHISSLLHEIYNQIR